MLKITNFDYVGYELDYAQSTHTMGIVILVLPQSNHHQLPWTDVAVPLRIRGRLIQMSPDDVEKIDTENCETPKGVCRSWLLLH